MSAEVPGPNPEMSGAPMGNTNSVEAMRRQFLGETTQATPEAQDYMIKTRGLDGVDVVTAANEPEPGQASAQTGTESYGKVTWESIADKNFTDAMKALETVEGADYRTVESGVAQTRQSEASPVAQFVDNVAGEVTQESPAQTTESTVAVAPKKHGRRAAQPSGNVEGKDIVPDGKGKHRAGPRTTDVLGGIPENMEPVTDVIGRQMDQELVSSSVSQTMSADELEAARRDAYEQSRGIGDYQESDTKSQENKIIAGQDDDADRDGHDRGEDVDEYRNLIRGIGLEDEVKASTEDQPSSSESEGIPDIPEALRPMFDVLLAQNKLLAEQNAQLAAQNKELQRRLIALERGTGEKQPITEEEPDADRDGTRGEDIEEYRRQIRGVGVENDTTIEANEPPTEPVEPVEPGTTPRGFRNRLKNIFRKAKNFPLWLATKTQNGINRTAEFYNDPEKGRRRKIGTVVGAGALLLAGATVLWARSKGHEVDASVLSYDTPMDQLAKDIADRDPVDLEAARAAAAEALAGRTLNVESGDGFIRAISNQYEISRDLAEKAYNLVASDLSGLEGTYLGPKGDVRISHTGPFEIPESVYIKVQEYLKSQAA